MSGNKVNRHQREIGKRHNRDIYENALRLQLPSLYAASYLLFL